MTDGVERWSPLAVEAVHLGNDLRLRQDLQVSVGQTLRLLQLESKAMVSCLPQATTSTQRCEAAHYKALIVTNISPKAKQIVESFSGEKQPNSKFASS